MLGYESCAFEISKPKSLGFEMLLEQSPDSKVVPSENSVLIDAIDLTGPGL